ncbi:ABC1 kinase family protein [Limosilactobacillus fastidiosus]|uniref:AarF/ABC1/UbiB kinase family protein n=1 Tax=Limosilactobacillus fastidiosus TaxID=2759855 RepID=A0ABR6E812_9LACO|nr:AarF/UbiB family protein [Limosilactobacillus fastidiosus]MBB1063335.1 AarF/ABC1/UbiB kinase family protein [Limosilactobacillus fastidiosus]MCD7084493.1 AarF/UbiB family protein [Limosilactobacillus fastidiosus]
MVEETVVSPGKRLRRIMRIMREYHFLSNFYHQKNPEEVCQALEELGPTFIKMGQILSTRSDLVSPEYIKAFRKLQDNVPADDFASVKTTFETETGKKISEVFKSFDKKAFASASIGQVHHAELKDGTPVVVKIQHPDVTKLVDTDLALLKRAVELLKYVPTGITVVDPVKIFNALSSSLKSEIDTIQEAKNGIEFYRLNNGQSIIRVPKVYFEYCAPKILVNEFMQGKSIKYLANEPLDKEDPEHAQAQQGTRHELAQALVKNFLKQVFVDHFFQADPHPGNILIHKLTETESQDDQFAVNKKFEKQVGNTNFSYQKEVALPPYRVIWIDFGMMGRISPSTADGIAKIVLAINSQDIHEIGQSIIPMCEQVGPLDEQKFYRELGRFLRPYLNIGLADINFTKMLYQIVQLCKNNNLRINSQVTMLVRAFGILETIIAKLDPSISMLEVARPFGQRYLKQHFNFRNQLDNSLWSSYRAIKAITQMPGKLNTFFDAISGGDAQINFHYSEQEQLMKWVSRIVNRVIIAIILAAIIVGSSLLVEGSADHPHIYRLGVLGYSLAIFIIVVMTISELLQRYRKYRQRKKEYGKK